ncbi:MAG: hydrogenase maturation protease [Ktedonobacteraceae bacterium]
MSQSMQNMQIIQNETAGRRVLIACIGNIFLGDDGFGVEVAQHLRRRAYPPGVQVIDFGISGIELAYSLLNPYDELVLVDAVQRGKQPGTVYLIEPDLTAINVQTGGEARRVGLDTHSMDPLKVLAFARTLGAQPVHTLLVGCEIASIGNQEDYTEMQMGLSAPVQAAVAEAVNMVDQLICDWFPKYQIVEKERIS